MGTESEPSLGAVIFDMDGVILDSEPHHHAAETLMFKELGIAPSDRDRDGFVGMSNAKMWAILKKMFGLRQSEAELLEFGENIRFQYLEAIRDVSPMPGLVSLLDELKANHVKMAVASSSSSKIIELFICRLSLHPYFQFLVSGEMVPQGKPEPDIFLHAAALLRTNAVNCVVIEDSENGAKAAQGAKMKCVGFKRPVNMGQNLSRCELQFADFKELTYSRLAALLAS